MPSSVFNKLNTPISIVCHDAGAANHIFSWMSHCTSSLPDTGYDWQVFLSGPARKILSSYNLPQAHLSETIDKAINNSKTLICGTGWESNTEYDAIKLARRNKIESIAVIDHWTNYKERFIRNGVYLLPDQIWVVDEYARKLANSVFTETPIVQKQNLYLDRSAKEIRNYDTEKTNGILYLLEPIPDNSWGVGIRNSEFIALDFFVENLMHISPNAHIPIRLRPHPSEPTGKYNRWISTHSHLNLELDKYSNLSVSIANADIVVGCQTYAMVLALASGRKVFTSIPAWAPDCVLPYKEIVKISDLE